MVDVTKKTGAEEPAPHVVPSDRGVVVISRWQASGRRAQRATADVAMARWQDLPWPDGCLSMACLLSVDGQFVTFYGQWTDEQRYERYTGGLGEGETADRVVDGIQLDAVVSRLAGLPTSRADNGPFPGCVALVSIATDGPDRQRQAAQAISAFGTDAHPGAIGGHVLFSLDGTRVTLYAEWTSEEAHREAIAGSAFGGQRGIFHDTPGIRGLSMQRYQLYRAVSR